MKVTVLSNPYTLQHRYSITSTKEVIEYITSAITKGHIHEPLNLLTPSQKWVDLTLGYTHQKIRINLQQVTYK